MVAVVVDGFRLRLVVLVVLVAVARVAAVLEIMEPQERTGLVAVVALDQAAVQLQERVVRELWWCVMRCQMFLHLIFMQQTTWVDHQLTISHLQQH